MEMEVVNQRQVRCNTERAEQRAEESFEFAVVRKTMDFGDGTQHTAPPVRSQGCQDCHLQDNLKTLSLLSCLQHLDTKVPVSIQPPILHPPVGLLLNLHSTLMGRSDFA